MMNSLSMPDKTAKMPKTPRGKREVLRLSLSFLLCLLGCGDLVRPVEAGAQEQEKKMVGLYIHQHWPYRRPYAARTWTLEDWRGWAGGLKQIGYNTLLIWPMLETIPEPMTPS